MYGLFDTEANKSVVENYFGLRESPFGMTPDPRYFYNHSLYMEGLRQLTFGIQAKKGMILLTGESGTGKTILLRKLMRDLPTTRFIAVSSRHLSADSLVEMTVRELGLPADDTQGLQTLQKLEGFLLEELRQRRHIALLIDEAQELSDDALLGLCELSNLETDKEKLLQIILVGQPELTQRLTQPALQRTRQRIARHYRLSPLPTVTDVEHYIRHRLEIAGHDGAGIFEPDAIVAIGAYTVGTPRLINVLCDNALALAATAGRKQVNATMIDQAATLLLLERGEELPRGDSAIKEPSGALPADESPADQAKPRPQPEMRAAKSETAEVLAKTAPKATPESSPAPQPNNGPASRDSSAAPKENPDIARLKAAMAAIRIGPAPAIRDDSEKPKPTRAEDYAQAQQKPSLPLRSQTPAAPAAANLVGTKAVLSNEVGVPGQFFDYMVHEATEALGPIGQFVVQEHIVELGESRDRFPRNKLPALVEAVSSEIMNLQMRANFELAMRRELSGVRAF